MKSTPTHRRSSSLFSSLSLDLLSNKSSSTDSNDNFDDDDISIASINQELTNGLHNLTSYLSSRRFSHKRLSNTIINHKDSGLIANGLLFDKHLFQSTRSSYIIDYSDTPQDLNKFLEGHCQSNTNTKQLDPHLFKLAFILTLSDWYIDKEILLGYYPHEITHLDEISNYKRFCFPELNPLQKNEQLVLQDASTYVFTRILSDGQVEYGYCRRLSKDYNQITKYPIVICLVSTYPYFKLYDAILTELSNVYISNELECTALIQSFYSKPIPNSTKNSSGITCILNDRRLFFYTCPQDIRLNHDYFSTLLTYLSPNHIIYLFESMLLSRRILVFSSVPSKLTKCCLALSFLLYPFIWPYSFVSLMPSSWLQDLLDSPCPFIYGCLSETLEQIPSTIDSDIIRVDLDSNTIIDQPETFNVLPLNLRQTLEDSLEYLKKFRLVKLNSTLINIAVSEACLRVFVELFFHLPDFFKRQQIPVSFSLCSNYFTRYDSGIDLQSVTSIDCQQTKDNEEENRLGYEFRSKEFLDIQPNSSYVSFFKEFLNGMIFLKFLDDYQRNDTNKIEMFSLFYQRLDERRQMTSDDLTIHPLIRFRQTIDLLENQIKQTSKQTNSSLSKFVKTFWNRN